jgi:T5orf172 domain
VSKPGYIYLIHAVGTKRYKIGLTVRSVEERFNELNSSQSAYPLQLIAFGKFPDVNVAEKEFHARYSRNRVYGEWFEFTNREARSVALSLSKEEPLISMWQIAIALLLAVSFATCQIQKSNHVFPQQIKNER